MNATQHNGGTVLKKLISILTFILIMSVSVCAFALPYADQTYHYNIDLPEGEAAYYYTQEGSNMPEDLLSVAQGKTPPVSFLAAAYENGTTLSYSVDMTATPITGLLPDLASGTTVMDLSMLTAEQLDSIAQNKKAEYGSVYVFDADTTETLAGKTALVLTGRHAEDNGYTTKIYLLADNNNLFVVTMFYKNDASNAYLTPAEAILSTLQFDSTPVSAQQTAAPTVTPAPTPAATVSAVPTATPAPQPSATAGASGAAGIQQFFQNTGQRISDAYYNDPYFPLYVAGICVVAALIIIIIVLIRASRRRNIPDAVSSILVETKMDSADTTSEKTGEDRLSKEPEPAKPSTETPMEPAGKTGAAYDLSKYTRSPRGYDVGSPITRPTIAEESLSRRRSSAQKTAADDVPKQAAPAKKAAPQPVRDSARPKVGSRVERNKGKYKKRK